MSGATAKEKNGFDWRLLGLALLIVLAIGAGGLLYQSQYSQEAADSAREYARYGEQKVGQACRGTANVELASCFAEARIENELRQYDNQREQADLVAQRQTALWTTIMGVAAVIGMALSAVGVILVWQTFRATSDANQIAKETQIAQLRAWVSIEARLLRVEGTEHKFDLSYEVILKNIGQTAARHMTLMYRTFVLKESPAQEIDAFFSEWTNSEDRERPKALMPDEVQRAPGTTSQSKKHITWQGSGRERGASFILVATVWYWSEIDASWHRTDRSFTFGERNEVPFMETELPESLNGVWKDRESIDERFVVTPYRSGVTT